MSILKLLSWNMNQKAANWQAVIDSAVDLAMLQEAKPPHKEIAERFITAAGARFGGKQIALAGDDSRYS